MVQEGQDPLYATLLAANLGQLMLGVARELFPNRKYFDLTRVEKQTVAEHVRNLLHEAQDTFAERELLHPRKNVGLPPQRDEDYL